MDDRRFDALARSFATGSSRRQVLRGLLGLGAGVVAASSVLEADAARRTTPTPAPIIKCPGRQTFKNGVCTCPDDAPYKCGPDCCTHGASGPIGPGQSVCCDGACCFGECYDEEYCCPDGRELCVTGECCPEGSTCCADPYFGVGCISGTQCCGNPDCEVPPPCHSTTCYPGNECSARFDCTVDREACCPEGQLCLDGGECCTSNCGELPPCSIDVCLNQCPCSAGSGDICVAETCAPPCPSPGLPCGACDDCGCLYEYGGTGTASCLDTSTSAGSCNDFSDCPAGTVCSEIASSDPGFSYLCLYPCCAAS